MRTYIANLCIAAALILWSCHNHNHSHGNSHDEYDHSQEIIHDHDDEHLDEIIFTKQQAEAAELKVEEVVRGIFSQVIKTSGQIVSAQGDEITIVAASNGIVSFTNLSISEGIAIRAGETLVTISARNILEGDPVMIAKIAYESAQKEFQRASELIKNDVISVREYEQIQSRYETAKTIYEAQASNITADGIKVASPISGYLKNRLVNQGEYVSVGQPIAVISRNNKLQLRAEVSESYFKELKNVSSANFKPAYDNTVYKLSELNGRLLSFGRTTGGQSFYIPVTFEFDNSGDILAGSYADIYLLSTPVENVISVPISAITEEQGLFFVYIQLDDECYEKQEVTLGQNNGERTQILSGLHEGDKVVTKGVYHVKLAAISSIIPDGHGHAH